MKYLRLCCCLLAMLLSQALPAQTIQDLEAYYSFDNCDASDDTGGGSNGQLVGDPQCVCGVRGEAIELDGVDDYILLLGDIGNLFSTANFTFSMYFKPKGVSLLSDLVSKQDNCDNTNAFGIQYSRTGNSLRIKLAEDDSKVTTLSPQLDFTDCWQHLTIVRRGGRTSVYINAEFMGAGQAISRINLSNQAIFSIGDGPCLGPTVARFKGAIDEVRVYDRALEEDEIEDLYYGPDRLASRDTIVYLGSGIDTRIRTTCADDFAWSPTTGVQDPQAAETTIFPEETTTYRLSFFDEPGCTAFDTIRVTVIDPSTIDCEAIFLPDAFTPNGDGLNDTYGISNPFVIDALEEFVIYDRWGSRVFVTNDVFEQWDGRVGGEPVQPGVLLYSVVYRCGDEQYNATGTVTIVR